VIIRSAHEVPRGTLLKRVPVPRNLGVSPESRIMKGRRAASGLESFEQRRQVHALRWRSVCGTAAAGDWVTLQVRLGSLLIVFFRLVATAALRIDFRVRRQGS
jgi:hypothetical protein